MRNKILLMGKGKAAMDDFFIHLDDDFEVQTSSERAKDIMCHIKYFKPDALVFCLYEETKEIINMVESLKNKLNYYKIPLIIIGNQEECDDFERDTSHMSKLVLVKPISVRNIRDQIISFLDNWKIMSEADMVKPEYALEENGLFEREQDRILKEFAESAQNGMEPNATESEVIPEVKEKKHILVVDDDPMMLKLIKEHLKDSYQVATAINGSLALKFLENKKTDLIILDYEMPVENGAQVLEKIRSNKATASFPVIFLTGINDREKIKKVMDLKPQGYLLKPIDSQKLLSIIEKTIG